MSVTASTTSVATSTTAQRCCENKIEIRGPLFGVYLVMVEKAAGDAAVTCKCHNSTVTISLLPGCPYPSSIQEAEVLPPTVIFSSLYREGCFRITYSLRDTSIRGLQVWRASKNCQSFSYFCQIVFFDYWLIQTRFRKASSSVYRIRNATQKGLFILNSALFVYNVHTVTKITRAHLTWPCHVFSQAWAICATPDRLYFPLPRIDKLLWHHLHSTQPYKSRSWVPLTNPTCASFNNNKMYMWTPWYSISKDTLRVADSLAYKNLYALLCFRNF